MYLKRVAVTGAAGFVGANIVRRLVRDGHDVDMLVHPSSDRWRLDSVASEAAVHLVDLEDVDAVTQLISRRRPDWIFHAAAHGAYPFQTDLRKMIATNLIGTINLVEAGLRAGFEAFVHTGSSSEYGAKDHAPAEDEVVEPNSHYAVTKASATLYCRHAARAHDAAIRVLRLYSVYGPWEEPSRLMPRLLTQALSQTWPPLASPDTARDYVYADDVVEAYIATATVPDQELGAVYNIGTGIQTSLKKVVDVVRRQLSVDPEPQWGTMANRSWDTAVWVAQPAAALKEIGWSAHHDLSSGLGHFTQWLRDWPDILERYQGADA